MTTAADQVLGVEAAHILQVYKRLPLVLVRGAGARITDCDGREYIDLLSGIGVASLGHGHAGLAAGDRGTGRGAAAHLKPLLPPAAGTARGAARAPVGVAARVLLQQRHGSRRGLPQVRAALTGMRRAGRGRTEIVAFERSFHGRTFGSLSVTSGAP